MTAHRRNPVESRWPLLAPQLEHLSHCRERLDWAIGYISAVKPEEIGDLENIEIAAIQSRMRKLEKELKRLT